MSGARARGRVFLAIVSRAKQYIQPHAQWHVRVVARTSKRTGCVGMLVAGRGRRGGRRDSAAARPVRAQNCT